VGADVRVDAVRVDPDDLEALGARTGVRGVAEAYTDPAASVEAADGPRQVLLVAVDPARYAQVLQGTPLEADLPAVPPSADRLPALVSPGLEVDDDSVLVVRQTDVPIGPVAVVPGLGRVAAGRDSPVVLVPLVDLRQRVPLVQANTAFVEATPAAADALSVVPPDELTPGGLVTGVETADRVAAGVSGLALPSLVTATYTAAGAFAVLLTLLAVLLVLAATHDERTALAVRLRVLGMARGVDRAVAWTEVLPVVVVAALAGGVVGTLAPWLVSAAVDLAPFTGAVSRVPVPPRPALALAAAGSVVALGALALVLDALAARRGSLADHLRQGASA
jgi:putative ABC transport system permease protein